MKSPPLKGHNEKEGSPRKVDYDLVAESYDERYQRSDYSGVASTLLEFIGDNKAQTLEVGCGTGHWLALLRDRLPTVAGMDLSLGMLERARLSLGAARLVLGRAEVLPWRSGSFDRIFCINAFHHFSDKAAFVRGAFRSLRPNGGFLTVGLDPHTETDRWWIYDYFEGTLEIDKERYPPTREIRALMEQAGFERCQTHLAQHNPRVVPARTAAEIGLFDKTSTSQLAVLSDHEFQIGLDRIGHEIVAARKGDQELMLTSDIRLYATTGWVA